MVWIALSSPGRVEMDTFIIDENQVLVWVSPNLSACPLDADAVVVVCVGERILALVGA
jgi:hypothetical protein